MSKLNVNVGNEFPLDGDVAMRGCDDFSREMWRAWKHEQHEMRARWKQEWRERFHLFRQRMKQQKAQHNA